MVSVFRLPATFQTADGGQGQLALEGVDGSRVHALGMGILSDGTPFLTQRGLANLCGVENAHIGIYRKHCAASTGVAASRVERCSSLVTRLPTTTVTFSIASLTARSAKFTSAFSAIRIAR